MSVSTTGRDQEEQQAAQLAAKSGIPYYDTRELQEIESVPSLLGLDTLRKYQVAPLHVYEAGGIELGLVAKTDRTKLPELQKNLPEHKLTFKTISQAGFTHIINTLYYHHFRSERDGDFKTFGARLAKAAPKDAFSLIAQMAYWLGASDIHIEPQGEEARIRYRLDGILHPITNVKTKAYEIFLSDLQTKAQIKWGSEEPQSGRISMDLMNNQAVIQSVNMRIETIPTFHGEEIVVRIFTNETRLLDLEKMGFAKEQVQKIDHVSSHPNGMIMTVGPTGSGKTSTLYAIINRLNNPEVKIVTLEDPVEYDIPGVSQVPVHSEDKELFAEKLRAVMREDPNVVMIGEIRDVDTAKTALQAALTGHLVLSTFHAANASAAISRMLDMIGQNPLFASSVRMIIAQRLARRICPECVVEKAITADEKAVIDRILTTIEPGRRPKISAGLKLKHGAGCAACHGIGYKGRIAIIEMMPITPDIEKMMTKTGQTTAQDLQAAAVKDGMVLLQEDGLHKVLDGYTTVSEIAALDEIDI